MCKTGVEVPWSTEDEDVSVPKGTWKGEGNRRVVVIEEGGGGGLPKHCFYLYLLLYICMFGNLLMKRSISRFHTIRFING